jgi:hypothetical protein
MLGIEQDARATGGGLQANDTEGSLAYVTLCLKF